MHEMRHWFERQAMGATILVGMCNINYRRKSKRKWYSQKMQRPRRKENSDTGTGLIWTEKQTEKRTEMYLVNLRQFNVE